MSNFHTNLVNRVHLFDIEPTKWAACKSVLHCLANHANESERDLSWPGMELMMLETGMSESAITRATGVLHDTKWVVRKRRFKKSNVYRLNRAKLEQNQVAKPQPKAIHMAQHLADMLFPGETLEDLAESEALAQDRPAVPGRSTARQRAARLEQAKAEAESPQVSEPVDNSSSEKPQVGDSYVKSPYSNTPSNTSNRRDSSRQIAVSTTRRFDEQTITEPSVNEETSSVRPFPYVSNVRATEPGADGRTDADPSPATENETESRTEPSPPTAGPRTPEQETAAALLNDPVIAAHLTRVGMRRDQRRRLETALTASLRQFSVTRTARYLREKAEDADKAMWLVRAFEVYGDDIALIGEPATAGHTTLSQETPVLPPSAPVDGLESTNGPSGPEPSSVIDFEAVSRIRDRHADSRNRRPESAARRKPLPQCPSCAGDGWVLGPDHEPLEPAVRCACTAPDRAIPEAAGRALG